MVIVTNYTGSCKSNYHAYDHDDLLISQYNASININVVHSICYPNINGQGERR